MLTSCPHGISVDGLAPKSLDEYQTNVKNKESVLHYVDEHMFATRILLSGGDGIGKKTLLNLVCSEYQFASVRIDMRDFVGDTERLELILQGVHMRRKDVTGKFLCVVLHDICNSVMTDDIYTVVSRNIPHIRAPVFLTSDTESSGKCLASIPRLHHVSMSKIGKSAMMAFISRMLMARHDRAPCLSENVYGQLVTQSGGNYVTCFTRTADYVDAARCSSMFRRNKQRGASAPCMDEENELPFRYAAEPLVTDDLDGFALKTDTRSAMNVCMPEPCVDVFVRGELYDLLHMIKHGRVRWTSECVQDVFRALYVTDDTLAIMQADMSYALGYGNMLERGGIDMASFALVHQDLPMLLARARRNVRVAATGPVRPTVMPNTTINPIYTMNQTEYAAYLALTSDEHKANAAAAAKNSDKFPIKRTKLKKMEASQRSLNGWIKK